MAEARITKAGVYAELDGAVAAITKVGIYAELEFAVPAVRITSAGAYIEIEEESGSAANLFTATSVGLQIGI